MTESTANDERTIYAGSCHCGSIQYTVALDDALAPGGPGKINCCNCSICTKNGYLLVYPRREDVVFHDSCDAKLTDYYFGAKTKPHRFCPRCGSNVLIDFKDSTRQVERQYLALNARLFLDLDLDSAQYTRFDGRTRLQPAYEQPPASESSLETRTRDSMTVYDANCHCGAFRYTLALSEALAPEGEGKMRRCNCPICVKNGYLLVYTRREYVRFLQGSEAELKAYTFGEEERAHRFCGKCGSSIGVFRNGDETDMFTMNARMFSTIDLENAEYEQSSHYLTT